MVYSIDKTIMASFSGLSASTYYTYQMAVYDQVAAAYVTLFTGRAYTDTTGAVSVRVDNVLRDYAVRWKPQYNASLQALRPSELLAAGATALPKERGGEFFIGAVQVLLGGQTQSFNVWAGSTAPWVGSNIAEQYTGNLATIGNSVLPHIPPKSTSQMWIGVGMYITNQQGVLINFRTRNITVAHTYNGTYFVAYTLADLFSGVPPANYVGYVRLGIVSAQTAYTDIAFVDQCASPYYVAWSLPNGGWACWGFDGNTTYTPQTVATEIDTYDGYRRVVGMETDHIIQLNSGVVTRDVWQYLCTLNYCREVYLYDVKNDVGRWCTVESRQQPSAGNAIWHMQNFGLTLKDNQTLHK